MTTVTDGGLPKPPLYHNTAGTILAFPQNNLKLTGRTHVSWSFRTVWASGQPFQTPLFTVLSLFINCLAKKIKSKVIFFFAFTFWFLFGNVLFSFLSSFCSNWCWSCTACWWTVRNLKICRWKFRKWYRLACWIIRETSQYCTYWTYDRKNKDSTFTPAEFKILLYLVGEIEHGIVHPTCFMCHGP